jgi:hypothetical protein
MNAYTDLKSPDFAKLAEVIGFTAQSKVYLRSRGTNAAPAR